MTRTSRTTRRDPCSSKSLMILRRVTTKTRTSRTMMRTLRKTPCWPRARILSMEMNRIPMRRTKMRRPTREKRMPS